MWQSLLLCILVLCLRWLHKSTLSLLPPITQLLPVRLLVRSLHFRSRHFEMGYLPGFWCVEYMLNDATFWTLIDCWKILHQFWKILSCQIPLQPHRISCLLIFLASGLVLSCIKLAGASHACRSLSCVLLWWSNNHTRSGHISAFVLRPFLCPWRVATYTSPINQSCRTRCLSRRLVWKHWDVSVVQQPCHILCKHFVFFASK